MKNCGPLLILLVLAVFSTIKLSNGFKLISHIKKGSVMVGNQKKPILFNIITMQHWANKKKDPASIPTGTIPTKFQKNPLIAWMQSSDMMNNLWVMLKEMIILSLQGGAIRRDTTNNGALLKNETRMEEPTKMAANASEPLMQISEVVTETTATKLAPQKVFLLLEVDESLLSSFNDTEILNNLLANATVVNEELLSNKPQHLDAPTQEQSNSLAS